MKTLLKLIFVSFFIFFSCSTKDDSNLDDSQEEPGNLNLVDRFIAHGAGEIKGLTYTNSLEALNLSYSKGCKLFELDIIETSDNKLVAAHDWKFYKTITNYAGVVDDTPLTEEEFLSLKIYGEFTPVNMAVINEWFAAHEDAILVTDKINDPAGLRQKGFLFKDRVIMELFSWEAVDAAIKEGIKPMPSENLVFQTPGIKEKLSGLNIGYIAISRRYIANNKDFLKKLKKKNVKTYVYHVNFEQDKDEKYVLENEIEYVYGMYADNLDLILNNTSK